MGDIESGSVRVGQINLKDYKMDCYVVSGQRFLSPYALAMYLTNGEKGRLEDIGNTPYFKTREIQIADFTTKAVDVGDIVDLMFDLSKQKGDVSARAWAFILALAKIGTKGVVDEQTDYQQERGYDDLRKAFDSYIVQPTHGFDRKLKQALEYNPKKG